MASARKWIGGMFLRVPAPLRSVGRLPLVGRWMHRLSYAVLPPDERHWVQVQAGPSKGLWLELNPRTGESYFRGQAEETVQKMLAKRLEPGMVFYDIGANIGLFSLLAARIVGPNGCVVSFEPDSSVATRLRRNIARNEFSNVAVVEMGVWSSSSKIGFVPAHSASPDRGTGRFVSGQGDSSTPIQCVALDDFVADHPPPSAIKCDVEGAELEVLRGAENLIRMHRPWVLGEMHSDINANGWRDFFSQLGYAIEHVDASHILVSP